MKLLKAVDLKLCLILISWVTLLNAQNNKGNEYTGFLTLDDNTLISYKISFKQLADYSIEGYSVTDYLGKDKTKSKIIGTINPSKNTISFKETSNQSSLSNTKLSEFCFVNVTNARFDLKNEKNMIDGDFTGKYLNDSICAKGRLTLVESNSNQSKKNIKPDSTHISNLLSQLSNTTSSNHLSSNDVLKLNWSSEKLVIELWDAAFFDGDKVSLFLNDKPLLENFLITNTKKRLELSLSEGITDLRIIAVNEGESPPNTVNFILHDGDKSIPVISSLKIGESSLLQIIKNSK